MDNLNKNKWGFTEQTCCDSHGRLKKYISIYSEDGHFALNDMNIDDIYALGDIVRQVKFFHEESVDFVFEEPEPYGIKN